MVQHTIYQLDTVFGLDTLSTLSHVDRAKHVSNQLRDMSVNKISQLIGEHGLEPFQRYLKNIQRGDLSEQELIPYFGYVDSYMIEMSGGNRNELQQLGQQIVNQTIPISTPRLMRSAILIHLFDKTFDKDI